MSDLAKYIDKYDKSKNYVKLLAVPGRPYQSREVIEVQTQMYDHLERIARTYLKDGIVSGCDYVDNGTNIIAITPGKIFIGGLILENPSTVHLTITKKGKETIGVKIVEDIITAQEDEGLRDPAAGYGNYMNEGCDRLKYTLSFVLNDPSALTLYSLIDGLIETQEEVVHDNFTDTLARRTFDESGNYRIRGLSVTGRGEGSGNFINMSLEAGKAYIRGYEVEKPASTIFTVAKSLGFSTVIGEPHIAKSGSSQVIKLITPYVKAIKRVVVEEEISQTITRGQIVGGTDFLPRTPVVSVIEVKESQSGAAYTRGTDWNLTENGISWAPGGREPSIGASYWVKYTVNTEVSSSNISKTETNSISTLTIRNTTVKQGSQIQVDYEFFLARKDLVCLDSKGNIVITEGQPNMLNQVEAPSNTDRSILRLATVVVYPNSLKTEVIDVSVKNTSMEDLSYLKNRVDSLEYNLALTDLDREALDKEPANYLRGILTDGFVGYTKVDISHPQCDYSMDLDAGGELTLPYTQTLKTLVKKSTSSVKNTKRFYISPYREVVALSQPLVSSTILVNPYLSIPKLPILTITPEVDSWIEESTKEVQGGDKVSVTTSRSWWRKRGEQWLERENNTWENIKFDPRRFTLSTSTSEKTTTTVDRSKEVATTVQESEILYMRRREINFSGENFIPFENNIEGWFDGKKVTLTGSKGTTNGAVVGTLRAKADGTLQGKFMIPENVMCGTREFSLVPQSTNSQSAVAYYSANGRKRDITKTVFNIIKKNVHTSVYTTETLTGIVRRRENNRADRDPVAQTFEFDRDRVLTSVELFFHSKDNLLPVIVQIRDVVNGYPGTSVYAEKLVPPSQINVSSDASLGTKITFDDPVYCDANTQFCFVVITESRVPRVYIAKLGEQELGKSSKVQTQPYIAGVLFSGSNTKTWTAHQDSDLKFKLYCAEFSTPSTLEFEELTGLQADRFMFLADYFTPKNTSIAWEYSLDGRSWQPTADYSDREFSKVVNSIKLRATLHSTKDVSPTLSQNSFSAVSFKNKLKCVYITRNVYHEQGFNNILQEIDYFAPDGSNVIVKYATDTSGTTWHSLSHSSVKDLGEGWKRLTLSGTISQATNFRARIELTTGSATIRPRVKQLLNVLTRK